MDVVLYLSPNAFSTVPSHIDPNSTFGLELNRRQKLQDDTLPFRGGSIRFSEGVTSFTHESEAALKIVLAELQRDRSLVLLVKAHADSTEAKAPQLSENRAASVANWLVAHGIERQRLATLGCGSSRPAWYDDTDQHRMANRRAELVRRTKWAGCQPPASFEWQERVGQVNLATE